MGYKFSESAQVLGSGLYNTDINSEIPLDAINITNEQHTIILSEKNNGKWHTVCGEEITAHESIGYWLQGGTYEKTSYNQQTVPDGSITTPPPSDLYTTHDGVDWILDTSAAEKEVRDERNTRLMPAFDCQQRYDREQANASLVPPITVSKPMSDADYHEVMAYIQALLDITDEASFPWTGKDDPSCPWPTKPACVPDHPITE